MKRYELTIAIRGESLVFGTKQYASSHYCRISLPSYLTQAEALERAELIMERFPQSNAPGFFIGSLTVWCERGEMIEQWS